MGGTGVIDSFLSVFTSYIDSGFGLLSGEVAFLATTLAAIDITLAAIFWSWAPDEDIIARLAKKTLFVGVFAYLIGNWNSLARIVFESFAGLGLKASGTGMSTSDFLSPGRVAQVGIDAGRPILDSISGLMGYISFFENFVQIVVLLFAWIVVLLAFFILAIQLFVTLIEFKLTTLAGFVLIPFGLFGKTAFAAERVLGNVISSGVKVLVLAVIVGIGSTLFSQFTTGFGGNQPTIESAMSMVLAALSLLGPRYFWPRYCQRHCLRRSATRRRRRNRYGRRCGWRGCRRRGRCRARCGSSRWSAGWCGPRQCVSCRRSFKYRKPCPLVLPELASSAVTQGQGAASSGSPSASGPPAWATRMKRAQTMSHGASAATHSVRSADHAGGGASVDLSEGES